MFYFYNPGLAWILTGLLVLFILLLIVRYLLYPVFVMGDLGSSVFLWPLVILAIIYFANGGQ